MNFLKKLRDSFFAQKYRFDLGLQFLVFLNFALLIITASDKLKTILGVSHIRELILLLLPLAFIATWLFGYFLEVVVKSPQVTEKQSLERSASWKELFSRLDRIEKKLRK